MAQPTTSKKAGARRSRRDRWADWAVIAVVAAALLLGSVVMVWAEGQGETASNAGAGLTVRYPVGWLLKTAQSEDLAFQAVDPASGRFKTTFQVRVVPIANELGSAGAASPVTSTLTLVLNNLTLARAQQTTAYRPLEIVEGAGVDGQPAMEASYAYVQEGSDLFAQQIPVVVRGLDVATARGDRAYVLTLLAADDAFAAAEKEFRRFVAAASLGQP